MSTPSTAGQRLMRAAWYERKGRAHEVLQVGQMPVPEPGPNDVRIRVAIPLPLPRLSAPGVQCQRRPLRR